jgi:hypothetical protein
MTTFCTAFYESYLSTKEGERREQMIKRGGGGGILLWSDVSNWSLFIWYFSNTTLSLHVSCFSGGYFSCTMKDVYFSMKDVYFSMKDVYFSMKEVRWFFVKTLSIFSSENVTLYLRMWPMYLWKVLILFVKKTTAATYISEECQLPRQE